MTEEAHPPARGAALFSRADAVPGGEGPSDSSKPPETGDPVVDAALRDLAGVPATDLDAQLAAGEVVHRTLQTRLTDLGG